jgi:L-aminopeptidase/D-esterase-like protein
MPPGFGPIAGIKIGHAQDEAALRGCTVLLFDPAAAPAGAEGMVAACDVRGAASGSRELETLRAGHLAGRIHALLLTGGSAFGLDAAGGVMRWCEERGIGYDTGVARVPIVPAAVIFDLAVGDARRRPDAAMGYAACRAARGDAAVAEGNVGAGAGASVGKIRGMACAMKSGLGAWTEEISNALPAASGEPEEKVRVAALAVVNAFGDVRDPDSGKILAGARQSKGSRAFLDTAAALRAGAQSSFAGGNTVLVAVATNAALTREEAGRVAVMASAGLGRVLSPAFSMLDGDVVFALSLGAARADVNALGAAAAEAAARAIARGVTQAKSAGGLPGIAG